MPHNCPACGTLNDDWRPFCVRCSLRLDGARGGVPGTAGSAFDHYVAPESAPKSSGPSTGMRAAIAVLAIAMLAALAFGGITIAHRLHQSASPYDPPPRVWDPRLAPLAREAEKLRGLTFKHPVSARFYSDAAFDKLNTDDLDKPQSQPDIRRAAAELRALGMAPPGFDLAKSEKTLVSSSVLAFYDPKTQRISVRGTQLDVRHDVTIVHELTHALQDQYFDLQKIDPSNGPKGDSATALVEGDARDVEDRYVKSLSKAKKAEYDAEEKALDSSVSGAVASVPDALVLSAQAPYDFGERFVHALRAFGGTHAVNLAFERVPRSDWLYLDPVAYLDGATVTKVSRPDVPAGAKFVDDEGELGSFTLYLFLSERVDPHAALAASDTWRGDHTILYSQGGTTCVEADVAAHDARGVGTLESTLRTWSTMMPRKLTSVDRLGDNKVELRACDGGAHAPALTHHSLAAYSLPITRLELLDTFLDSNMDASTAWCASGQVVYTYDAAQLNDPKGTAFSGPEFTNRLKGWIRACQTSSATS
jgi:hypothetical protein